MCTSYTYTEQLNMYSFHMCTFSYLHTWVRYYVTNVVSIQYIDVFVSPSGRTVSIVWFKSLTLFVADLNIIFFKFLANVDIDFNLVQYNTASIIVTASYVFVSFCYYSCNALSFFSIHSLSGAVVWLSKSNNKRSTESNFVVNFIATNQLRLASFFLQLLLICK